MQPTTIPVAYSQRPTMPAPRDERLSLVPLRLPAMWCGDDVTPTVRPPAQETTKEER